MQMISNQLSIDQGTVYVTYGNHDMLKSHEISYHGQGGCTPLVEITCNGMQSKAKHKKNCHGRGKHQGTQFDVCLSPNFNHRIRLTAGQLVAPAPGKTDGITAVRSHVNVGDIRTNTALAKVKRKLILGAESHWQSSEAGKQLKLKVNLGEILLR